METVQNEEYLQDVDFDEIKRYDVKKRIGNLESQKLNLRKGHKHKGNNPRRHPEKKYRKKSGKISEKILGDGEFVPKIVNSREKRYYPLDYDSDYDYPPGEPPGFGLSDYDSDDSSDDSSDDDSDDDFDYDEASTRSTRGRTRCHFFLYQKLKEILTKYSRPILEASKDWLISKI